jgi:hypothetical protein
MQPWLSGMQLPKLQWVPTQHSESPWQTAAGAAHSPRLHTRQTGPAQSSRAWQVAFAWQALPLQTWPLGQSESLAQGVAQDPATQTSPR